MAANDTSDTIGLGYLVQGDNPRTHVQLIKISPNEYVGELAKAIQTDYKLVKGKDIVDLFLFKFDTLINQTAGGCTVNEDSFLQPCDKVSDYWQSDLLRIRGMIHILVRASPVELDTRSARASAVPTLPSLTSAALTPGGFAKRLAVLSLTQEKTVQTINSGPTPSVIARVSEFNDQQHRPDAPIHNGRPRDKQGLPLGIYHPIFSQFTRNATSSSIPDSKALNHMEHLLIAAQDIYRVEIDRISEIRGKLDRLLGDRFISEEIPGCKAGGVIKASLDDTHGYETAYTVIMEVKNEIGTGDSDPSVQGAESYARYWSNKRVSNAFCD
ncbi:hypothetical protein FRC10_003024 [Ceratobasidium sp. 414]|nr:hypothetical protein FRC10_003024 [Ceratobasidium sp. 414]